MLAGMYVAGLLGVNNGDRDLAARRARARGSQRGEGRRGRRDRGARRGRHLTGGGDGGSRFFRQAGVGVLTGRLLSLCLPNSMRVEKFGVDAVMGFTANHRLVGHQLIIVAPHSVLSLIAGS